jgi:hypothetical protein
VLCLMSDFYLGNECRYGPDDNLIPDTVPYDSADPKWGTYNYGARPVSWDHIWKDIIPAGGSLGSPLGVTGVTGVTGVRSLLLTIH